MPIEEDDDDREGTDPRDIARFDDDTIRCPDCGREIYDEAFRCPYCKSLITDEERTESHKTPKWVTITVVVCVILVILWIFYLFLPSG